MASLLFTCLFVHSFVYIIGEPQGTFQCLFPTSHAALSKRRSVIPCAWLPVLSGTLAVLRVSV